MIGKGINRIKNTAEKITRPSLMGYVGANILNAEKLAGVLGPVAGVSALTWAASSALVGLFGTSKSSPVKS